MQFYHIAGIYLPGKILFVAARQKGRQPVAVGQPGLKRAVRRHLGHAGVNAEGIEDSLKAHVQDKIGKWKYPRWIDIVPELPKTATGKIQRFKLREGTW